MSKKDREAVFYVYGSPCKLRITKEMVKRGFTPEDVVEMLDHLLGRDWRSKDVDVHSLSSSVSLYG